jgi:SAM-dependent methyltransferase
MVRSSGNNQPYQGITPIVGITAFNTIINEYGFGQDGEQLYPKRITNSHDAYNDLMHWKDFAPSTQRFIARYKKIHLEKQSLEVKIKENITNSHVTRAVHDGIAFDKNTQVWEFNDAVAEKFYDEAISNIPDYTRVVDLCVTLAVSKFSKDAHIVDVGSALGYTVDKFIQHGFTNVAGIEASGSMINHSAHPDRIILSDIFPKNITADLVLANWTLHFINEREQYIQDIFNALNHNGAVIITDKTSQNEVIKNLYYEFKRSNGVTDDYIKYKEEKLKGYMNCLDVAWYINTLTSIGFKNVQIINSRLGFVSFYAEK